MKKKAYKRNENFFFDTKLVSGFLAGILFTLLITSVPQYISFTNIVDYYRIFFTPVALAAYEKPFLKEIGSSFVNDGENIQREEYNLGSPNGKEESNVGQVVLHGRRDVKEVALTFDADMTPGMKEMLASGEVQSFYDRRLIDLLDQTHTKATVFATGMWMELYPDVTKELAANPLFELSNHSYSHPSFSGDCYGLAQVSATQYPQEIEKTQQLLREATGVTNNYFRFPGGCYSQDNLALIKQLGLIVVHWDVVSEDGFNNNVQSIEENVLDHVQNGSIIVMHFNGPPNEPSTAEALQVILPVLRDRGYHFVKVSELLAPQEAGAIDIKSYIRYLEGA